MSWEDFAMARQLLTEEFFGTRVRESVATEDEAARRAIEAIKGM